MFISVLLTWCLCFGLVPDSFQCGLLVPLIMKSNLDPSVAKSYRPIIMSVTISKLLEYYILEEISDTYQPSIYQFSYVPGRSTQMAAALMHDVGAYCNQQGSPTYQIPHSVLFDCVDAFPDACWRVMLNWYTNLQAKVKWNNQLCDSIPISKGTRQRGLSSPAMFNMF